MVIGYRLTGKKLNQRINNLNLLNVGFSHKDHKDFHEGHKSSAINKTTDKPLN
jgi:hypothetical protein